jgi:hypothetical protein
MEVRILERDQVDARRDVDDAVERTTSGELAKHARLFRFDGLDHGQQDGDPDQDPEPGQDRGEIAVGPDHGIDRLLSGKDLRADRECRDEREDRGDEEFPAARAPNEPNRSGDEPRQVAPGSLPALRVVNLDPRTGLLRALLARGLVTVAVDSRVVTHAAVVPRRGRIRSSRTAGPDRSIPVQRSRGGLIGPDRWGRSGLVR